MRINSVTCSGLSRLSGGRARIRIQASWLVIDKIFYSKTGVSPWDRDFFFIVSLPGSALLIGCIWQCIMFLLRMAQEKDDRLAMCHGEDLRAWGRLC